MVQLDVTDQRSLLILASLGSGAGAMVQRLSGNGFVHVFQAQRVVFRRGALEAVGDEARRLGLRRVLVVVTPSAAASGTGQAARSLLGDLVAATWNRVEQHVPAETAEAALALAREAGVDGVVSIGGGSAIGVGKAVAFGLSVERAQGAPGGTAVAANSAEPPPVPQIAVPTTYAGSELTPGFGTTDRSRGEKRLTGHPWVAPRVVLYDPLLTLDLPPAVTAATGMNALAHCVEALYSKTGSPVADLFAEAGIARLALALPVCVVKGDDAGARAEALYGAFCASYAMLSAGMALHHGICHSLGGKLNVSHGMVNAVMLPHVMRFNRPATGPALATVARAFGAAEPGLAEGDAADRAADGVSALALRMGLPARLRDLGVSQDDLPAVAADAMHSATVRANPRGVERSEEILEILSAAW